MKSILVNDTTKFIKNNKLEGSKEEAYFKKYNVKASLAVRLEFGENFWESCLSNTTTVIMPNLRMI